MVDPFQPCTRPDRCLQEPCIAFKALLLSSPSQVQQQCSAPWTSLICVSSTKCVYMCVRRCSLQNTKCVCMCVTNCVYMCVTKGVYMCVTKSVYMCVTKGVYMCVTKCVYVCHKMRLCVCHQRSSLRSVTCARFARTFFDSLTRILV